MQAILDFLQTILPIAAYILLFPGLLFTALGGLLLAGIDRKVLARMQRRIGPPVIQPFYDFFKLMGKETIVPAAARAGIYKYAPLAGTISLALMMLFFPIFGHKAAFGTTADLIVILYLLTIPAVAMIIGGTASGSPFAGIGISREMVTMLAYELPLVLVLLAVARKVGDGGFNFSLEAVSAWQLNHGCLLFHPAMIPAAIAFLLVIPAEVGTQPFDVAEAETEICEGPLVEYSGAPLAVFKLNTAMKMFVMTALFSVLFLGGINLGTSWYMWLLGGILLFVFSAVLTVLSMTFIHAFTARLKVEHLFKFYWTVVAALALISLVLVWLGL